MKCLHSGLKHQDMTFALLETLIFQLLVTLLGMQ